MAGVTLVNTGVKEATLLILPVVFPPQVGITYFNNCEGDLWLNHAGFYLLLRS
jgi:hypothetical protein